MFRMETFEFKMAPLSDFTVTFTDHRKKPEVDMHWGAWYRSAGQPDYDLKGTKLTFRMKKPEGINIIMPDNNPPYELEFSQ